MDFLHYEYVLRTAPHQRLVRFTTILRTNGYDPKSGEFMEVKDALDVQNAAFMIPRAMTQIVQEGIEPFLIGTSLLQRVQYQAGMQTVFPAIEPLRAEEAGDGMDLPIYNQVSSSCRNTNASRAGARRQPPV